VSVGNEWMAAARCRDLPPELFFPTNSSGVAAARRVCADCEVMGECLEYALAEHLDHGIWGGASERERRRLLSVRRKQSAERRLAERTIGRWRPLTRR
jgi:WhiB family transcriptional regulator, redox-sensing transcriptional regulator